jgi:molybdenum cofactor biosynthesis protein B
MSRYESPSAREHQAQAPASVACAVVTVSDTRTLLDDRSGAAIVELLEAAGHRVVARTIVPDEKRALEATVLEQVAAPAVQVVLITGGTGAAPRDQSPETIEPLFTKPLSGFGELFRMLSYQEIGAAAMLSRACAGLIDRTAVFLMPGSTPAVKLAMERLIVPELGHVAKLAAKQV